MFSPNLPKLTKQVSNLPNGVPMGLEWLLSQEDWFIKDFANGLLNADTETLMELKKSCADIAQKESMSDFVERIKYRIGQAGDLFLGSAALQIDTSSIRIEITSQSIGGMYSSGSRVDSHIYWLIKSPVPLDISYQGKVSFSLTNSMRQIINRVRNQTLEQVGNSLMAKWTDKIKVGEIVSRELEEEISMYSFMFNIVHDSELGLILGSYNKTLILERTKTGLTRTNKTSKFYKRCELAQTLSK